MRLVSNNMAWRGTKSQRHIGTKKERDKCTEEQRDKGIE